MFSNNKSELRVSPANCVYKADEVIVINGIVVGFVKWGITWFYPLSDFKTVRGLRRYYHQLVDYCIGVKVMLPNKLSEASMSDEDRALYDYYKEVLLKEGFIR